MSEAKIKAEAMLIVIKKILKWIGISLLCIVVMIFMAFEYEKFETKQKKKIEDKVTIRASYQKENLCNKDFPYQYIINNESGRVVKEMTFTIGIKRIGFSSNINRYTSIVEDKIIQNNESWIRCFRAEDAKQYGSYLVEKDVDIVVEYKEVIFKD